MQTMLVQVDKKDEKISKIIEKVLIQVFGAEATRLIYKHLEHHYSLKRDEVGERIEVFAQGLEDFLRSGAYVIERKILDDIYSSYGQLRKFEKNNPERRFSFVNEMKSAMRRA